MTNGIYIYRDIVSGEYSFFGMFLNDKMAVRAFKHACSDPNVFASDLELYSSGALDTKTGKIISMDDNTGVIAYEAPKFICRGEKDVQNNV